jgi:pimeloyl-ACP methyl ester carboxylesterase
VVEPPPDPTESGGITLHQREVDVSNIFLFDKYHATSRYERFQQLEVLSGSSAQLQFRLWDLASGGVILTIPAGVYELLVDDVSQSSVTMPAGQVLGTFTLDITGIADGWHILDIVRVADPTHSCAPWAVFVNKAGGEAVSHDEVPVMHGSYELAHYGLDHYWAMVPAVYDPTPMPLPSRSCPSFSTADAHTTLFRENMTPSRHETNINRVSITSDGVKSTFNTQNYFYQDLVREFPNVHLLDGPRGVGTLMMPTHIMPDRHGGAYCLDPWRVVRVSNDGTITTRCGYRHGSPPHNWLENGEGLELVGDWSAIPVDRRGFHELWGGAFDLNTVAFANLDTGAPQQLNSVNGEMEHPHSVGPRLFVADSQNNRICLLTFTRDSFTAEPVVTEFLTGLGDPWDVVWSVGTEEGLSTGVIYVSERTSHRIACYNATTGAFIRTVVEGAALASVNESRKVTPLAPLATIRAEDVVAPEGLFLQDGWLYYGSKAMQEVRRVNLDDGEIEVVCRPLIDTNSEYVKITVSDGTFGPLGMVFTFTFSNARFGMPEAWLPDTGPAGTRWGLTGSASFLSRGRGGLYTSLGYPTAGGVGQGRLYCGSTEEGLARISKVATSDPTVNETRYNNGATMYKALGYKLVYGDDGFGHQGLELPWGVHADMDYYLQWHGHLFKSVSVVSTSSFPATATTGQRIEMNLHASGGGNFTFGTRYEAICHANMSKEVDESFIFHVQDGSPNSTPDYIMVRPIDVAPDGPGGTMETLWFGYSHAPAVETAHPYTEEKLDALYRWVIANHPQANSSKVTLAGHSMGAWGGLSYGLRRPEMYAAIFVTLPRWKGSTLADYEIGFATTPPPGIPMSDTGEPFATRMNMITHVADTDNQIPFLAWAIGKNDAFSPFQDHIDAVAALRAANRAFVFSWNNGDHSSGADAYPAITATYSPADFELGVGYPIFSNSSLDDDPSTDLVGGINLGFRWRSVVESASGWSCEVSNSLGAVTVDVSPRSDIYLDGGTETVVIPAGTWVAVSFP